MFDNYTFTSDSDLEESPSKKAACRTAKVRRRGVMDRTRHSLTIVRLVDMGFKKEDAEASVKEIGDDLDACMLWIISKIEERQFYEDLNRASIQSERSKHDEEKRVKNLEKEKLAQADKFMAIFPTVSIVSHDAKFCLRLLCANWAHFTVYCFYFYSLTWCARNLLHRTLRIFYYIQLTKYMEAHTFVKSFPNS